MLEPQKWELREYSDVVQAGCCRIREMIWMTESCHSLKTCVEAIVTVVSYPGLRFYASAAWTSEVAVCLIF